MNPSPVAGVLPPMATELRRCGCSTDGLCIVGERLWERARLLHLRWLYSGQPWDWCRYQRAVKAYDQHVGIEPAGVATS